MKNNSRVQTKEIPCDLCGSIEQEFLFNARDRLHGFEGTFTYVRCTECSLVYMNPQILPHDICRFYPDDYGPHLVKRKKKNPHKCPRNANFFKKPFAAFMLHKLKRKSRLLDVGCGSGKFLNEIRIATGCEVYGVDISKVAAKTAKENYGLNIFTDMLTEVPFPDNYFDVITAWWFLEHVTNPSEVLRKMSRLLKYDGYCIIGVPNVDSFNARIFKDKWYHLDCPRHLYIYSPDTITKLLHKAGLVVTRIVFDKTPRGLLRSLRYCFGDDNIPLKQRKRLRGSSLLKKLLLPLTILLAFLKQADIMVVCARRLNDV